jgi:hypothetical protein
MGFTPTLSSYRRPVALAGEKFVDLDGIPRDCCFVNRLGALIPRRHPASLVEGDHRPCVQIAGKRRSGLFARRRPVLRRNALRRITIE